jgi:hypothetical protein
MKNLLKPIFLLSLFVTTSCSEQLGQMREQFSSLTDSVVDMANGDKVESDKVGSTPVVQDDALFLSIKNTWNSQCMTCHLGVNTTHENYFVSAQALADSPWVVKGDSSSSSLYTRLKGSGGPLANMPQGADPIDAGALADVEAWINDLESDDPTTGGTTGGTTSGGTTTGGGTTGGGNGDPDAFFPAFKAVMDSRCVGCHNPGDQNRMNLQYDTLQEYIDNQIVNANENASWAWIELQNNGGNMPIGGNLTPEQYQAIKDLIDELKK